LRTILIIFAAVLAALLLAAPVAAQGTWYVDPVGGNDLAGAGTLADPYKTLTHVLGNVAVAGDAVRLLSGTYSPGAVNVGETYPIALKDLVSIAPEVGNAPVFDGNGSATMFTVPAITASTRIELFQVTDFATGLLATGGAQVKGLIVEDTLFDAFTVAAADFLFGTGNENTITFRNCRFFGDFAVGAAAGARIQVTGTGTRLLAGSIEDCQITDCATGIIVESVAGGSIANTFAVLRNLIDQQVLAGIHLLAQPSGLADGVNSTLVQGNQVTGAGAGEIGLRLEANDLFGSTQAARVDAAIAYNVFSQNTTNVLIRTARLNGGGNADVISHFLGNSITGAADAGIEFWVDAPAALQPNASPVFGDNFSASTTAGRNSIRNNVGPEMRLDDDMQNIVKAEHNFWDLASGAAIFAQIDNGLAPLPDVDDFLATVMSVGLSPNKVEPNTNAPVVAAAGPASAFVHNPDPAAAIGLMLLQAGGLLATPVVFANGSGFTFLTPALAEGGHTVNVVNPGGQSASAALRATPKSSAGAKSKTGICVVATAAHGDYDAPEVRVLRRFRDDYLLQTAGGRALVRGYYAHGPVVAQWIEPRPWARAATRVALAPVVAMADLLHAWPAALRLLGGFAALALFWRLRARKPASA